MKLSLGALGALLLDTRPLLGHSHDIRFEDFIGDLAKYAEDVFLRRIDEETYVTAVMRKLGNVGLHAIPSVKSLPKTRRFAVVELSLDPGRGYRHHDHRNYNAVMFVTGGQVAVRNFDIVGENRRPVEGEQVLIQETARGLFAPGDAAALTTGRDNIHEVRAAGDGGRLIDIFTWMGPQPMSVYMDVESTPINPTAKIYRGIVGGIP